MAFDPRKIRIVFAAAACLLFIAVAGLYYLGRKTENTKIDIPPPKLGFNVQQAANGFNYTKNDGDKKQFTISASKVVQLKDNQRQAFSDVRIIMYGTEGDKGGYDQIWGKEFDYDPQSGDVKGRGLVSIVLAAQGTPTPDPEHAGKGTMRLSANGLSFNQKTGLARTDQNVDFELAQGKGSAVGAEYDSRSHTLTLHSNVYMVANERPAVKDKPNLHGTKITAAGAVITDNPREAIFTDVTLEQGERKAQARHAAMQLRPDNTIDRISANGDVRLHAGGESPAEVFSQQSELRFGIYSELLSAMMDDGVQMNISGLHPMNASAKHTEVDFGAGDKILQMRCSGGVKIEQTPTRSDRTTPGTTNQAVLIETEAIDFKFTWNNELESAVTHGAARLTSSGKAATGTTAFDRNAGATRTVLTADYFAATYAPHNMLKTLTGIGNVKSVITTPNKPDRTTSSREVFTTFDPERNGSISKVDQTGDFHYIEGPRNAVAVSGHYTASDESFLLSGAPRVEDASTGMTLTADSVRMERGSGNAHANGNVKSTFRSNNVNSKNGAMWSDSKEPVHATAAAMDYIHESDTAIFSSGARLWQGSNAVQASMITFNRSNKSLQASGEMGSTGMVQTSFLQTDRPPRLMWFRQFSVIAMTAGQPILREG